MSAHDAMSAAAGGQDRAYYANDGQVPPDIEYIGQWNFSRGVRTGRAALTSYDFERPSTSLAASQFGPAGFVHTAHRKHALGVIARPQNQFTRCGHRADTSGADDHASEASNGPSADMSVRLAVCLFFALAVLPSQALAEGWGGLFDVMAWAVLVIAFMIAEKGVWWFLAGAVLAWSFHIYRGADLEQRHGLWPLGYKPGATPTLGRALAWHLFAIRWALTFATLAAPIIIGIGHVYGLSSMSKPNTVRPVAKSHSVARAKWNREIPNGSDWPRTSGHMEGMSIDANSSDGGEIVLNNTDGRSHFYARLCAHPGPKANLQSGCVVKRNLFVKRGDSVRISGVAKGGYAIQVLDVDYGDAFVSPYIDWRQSTSGTLSMELPSGDQRHAFQPMHSGVFNKK